MTGRGSHLPPKGPDDEPGGFLRDTLPQFSGCVLRKVPRLRCRQSTVNDAGATVSYPATTGVIPIKPACARWTAAGLIRPGNQSRSSLGAMNQSNTTCHTESLNTMSYRVTGSARGATRIRRACSQRGQDQTRRRGGGNQQGDQCSLVRKISPLRNLGEQAISKVIPQPGKVSHGHPLLPWWEANHLSASAGEPAFCIASRKCATWIICDSPVRSS